MGAAQEAGSKSGMPSAALAVQRAPGVLPSKKCMPGGHFLSSWEQSDVCRHGAPSDCTFGPMQQGNGCIPPPLIFVQAQDARVPCGFTRGCEVYMLNPLVSLGAPLRAPRIKLPNHNMHA